MKKILGAILITFLVSCNSNSKTEKQLLEKENELLQRELELTKKEQNSDIKEVKIAKPKESTKPKEVAKTTIKAEKKSRKN